jgi:translation initiation factor IF-2
MGAPEPQAAAPAVSAPGAGPPAAPVEPDFKAPVTPTAPVAPAPESTPAVKRQRAKTKKKDMPARIISLPTEKPAPPPRPTAQPVARVMEPAMAPAEHRRPRVEPARPGLAAPPAKPVVEEKKDIKGKKKVKRPETTDAARAKAGKKREVRERADLYGASDAEARVPGRRRGVKKAIKKISRAELTVPKAIKRRVKVGESITVGELAKRMGIKSGEIIKKLLQMGVMATINYPIDYDSAVIVASEFGYEVERASMLEEDLLALGERKEGELKPRPPVVTIMGHVDHGKTSLLDAIRKTRVTEAEAGGITQHIGAYHVKLPDDQGEVVFLDTPGHEAFTAMRARGAKVTDLVVLVVAADDGVMEQTQEAINHARAAGVPLVVAINKIDKPNANLERVKRELANLGVVSEDWGGDILFAEVSAKKRIGIPDLLEKILLQAEILDLQAAADIPAAGRIIESRLDKGRGPVGTVLVQGGTLKPGDYFVCGLQYGRVRALFDDRGHKIDEVSPGLPAEVQGFSGVPDAGDEFLVLEDERKAKQIAMMRQQKQREATLARISRVSLEKLYQQVKDGAVKELKLILKADVHGSIEALAKAMSELGTKDIKVFLIHSGIGDITESDIMLASASDAIVVGFNVRANPKAQSLAEQEQVDLRFYDIIYNLLQDIHAALEGLLEPVVEEKVMGRAEVRQVFSITRVGQVAGCMVQDGKIERNSLARVLRQGQVVSEGGRVNSLKRFKDDVKEVQAGYECGIGIDRFNDFKEGDIIEAYTQEKVKAILEGPASRPEAAATE